MFVCKKFLVNQWAGSDSSTLERLQQKSLADMFLLVCCDYFFKTRAINGYFVNLVSAYLATGQFKL